MTWQLILGAFLIGIGGRAMWMLLLARRFRASIHPAIQAVMEPYRRGDYEASLEATEGLRNDGEITSPYCYFRGSNLAHLGRLEEAEIWLRRSIAIREETKEMRHLAISFSTLGHAMLQACRYDEAQKCFERSIRCFPARSSGYRSMAEMYLRRGTRPDEAVRFARLAIEKDRADRALSAEMRKLNLGENLATLAWATAVESHSGSEVSQLVVEAVASVGSTNVGSAAQVQYHSGFAFAELGDVQTSTAHYEEAAKLDPHGSWGRAAHAALQSTRQTQQKINSPSESGAPSRLPASGREPFATPT